MIIISRLKRPIANTSHKTNKIYIFNFKYHISNCYFYPMLVSKIEKKLLIRIYNLNEQILYACSNLKGQYPSLAVAKSIIKIYHNDVAPASSLVPSLIVWYSIAN